MIIIASVIEIIDYIKVIKGIKVNIKINILSGNRVILLSLFDNRF